MRLFTIPILILLISLLTACFKEDEKIAPHDPGDVELDSVKIAQSGEYIYQVYYKLGSKEVVSSILKDDWDLGFECSAGGSRIILNSSNFMKVAKSGLTDFTSQIDTAGYTWQFDASSGNTDTTAFGGWIHYAEPDSVKTYSNEVFVIDRGYDGAGNLRGLRKAVFQEVTDSTFTFKYADLDGSNEYTITINKDQSVNYICFTFDQDGRQLEVEPPKDQWDLIFTQYTTLLYTDEGDPYPYLLTGVLSNPAGILVAQDTLHDFASINLDVAGQLNYSGTLDEIGYDWKVPLGDVTTGNVTYVIVQGLTYVVRDAEGFYYKLRFVSFYNLDNGEKGYPTFEFQKL